MIYVLHGSDTLASYQRLQFLVNSYKNWRKIYTKSEEELLENLQTADLISQNKIVIAEFLPEIKKISQNFLHTSGEDQILVIWVKQEIVSTKLKPFQKIARIENFKLPTALFDFLDSISPNSQNFIKFIKLLDSESVSLNWHISNRLTQLILAKMGYTLDDTAEITGKNIAHWQWQKLQNQSKNFNLSQLRQLLTSTLRIDYLIKSGKTSIPQAPLLTLMFTKILPLKASGI